MKNRILILGTFVGILLCSSPVFAKSARPEGNFMSYQGQASYQYINASQTNTIYNNITINGNNNIINLSYTTINKPNTKVYLGVPLTTNSNNKAESTAAKTQWDIRKKLMQLDLTTLNDMFTGVSDPNFAQWISDKGILADIGIRVMKNQGLSIEQQEELINKILQSKEL